MSFFWASLVFIFMEFVCPVFVGCMWLLLVGGPIFLIMYAWQYGTVLLLNPVLDWMHENIPCLGRIITAIFAALVGIFLIGFIIMHFLIPMSFLTAHAFGC